MAHFDTIEQPNLTGALNAALDASAPRQHHGFYPYEQNGGSIVGIAGDDFLLFGGDTRMTKGYNINTRYAPRIFPLRGSPMKKARMAVALVGYTGDLFALKDAMEQVLQSYESRHNRPMSISAAARRFSHLLYSKRFFPFYVNVALGGLDEEGKGALYKFDPVGSYERERFSCASGAASSLIMPVLDNQVERKNHSLPLDPAEANKSSPEKLQQAKAVLRDAFTSAVERHIEVGDFLQVVTITKDGIQEELHDLKKD